MPKIWNVEIKLIQTDDISPLQKISFHMWMLNNIPLSAAPELMDNVSEDRYSQAYNKMLFLSLYQAHKYTKIYRDPIPYFIHLCLFFVMLGIEPKAICILLYWIFSSTSEINTNKPTHKDQTIMFYGSHGALGRKKKQELWNRSCN